ncbi:replication initiator [Streptomyces albidoflavus]|uniref:replication initiator n=1 Tax=Streptomyces albidoflavus TaxID=1886 RepID=UPI0033F82E0C
MLGFRGRFSTKSRSCSTTLGTLRAARRAWRTERAPARAGLPSTALIVGHRVYQGSGCNPGGAPLVAHVWHRREWERRFIAEGG